MELASKAARKIGKSPRRGERETSAHLTQSVNVLAGQATICRPWRDGGHHVPIRALAGAKEIVFPVKAVERAGESHRGQGRRAALRPTRCGGVVERYKVTDKLLLLKHFEALGIEAELDYLPYVAPVMDYEADFKPKCPRP